MKNTNTHAFTTLFIVGASFFTGAVVGINDRGFREENELFLIAFFLIGLALLGGAFFFLYKRLKEKKIRSNLEKSGTLISAKVLEVEHCTNIIVMNKSPYRVKYGYYFNNYYKEGYGDMLWEPPTYAMGDNIDVLVDSEGNSMIK